MNFEKIKEIKKKGGESPKTYSSDSKYLLFGNQNNILVYDSKTFELQHTLKGHTEQILTLKFSPCGKLLASGSQDKSVIIWDFEEKTMKKKFDGHEEQIVTLNFSKDGKHLAVGAHC